VNHADHLELIREGVTPGPWADLGSGEGAFTLALADLLGPGGTIVSIDRNGRSLSRQREAMEARFPSAAVEYRQADFQEPLDLSGLEGIVMANSLHFVRRKEPVLAAVRGWLRAGGRLVLVEYDTDRGNPWVPHPFSYPTWERVAAENGFTDTRRLHRRPSTYNNAMYSALSFSGR
jgi:ubiquinone/menaquinone biosynthesis C-methylase UbiE